MSAIDMIPRETKSEREQRREQGGGRWISHHKFGGTKGNVVQVLMARSLFVKTV